MITEKIYDVIIVGAGPVGLFLAYELGLQAAEGDVSVLVLERDPLEPTGDKLAWATAPLGTRGVNTASAEALYRRGLLDDILDPKSVANRAMSIAELQERDRGQFLFAGHFAGMPLGASNIDTTSACLRYKLPGPSYMGGATTLDKLCKVLRGRIEGMEGVELMGGVEVVGLSGGDQRDKGCRDTVAAVQASGGQEFRGRFVVGCDGGRSAIRKAAGFEFVGTDAELVGYSALCEFDDPHGRVRDGFWRSRAGILIAGSQRGDKAGQTHVVCMDTATATATDTDAAALAGPGRSKTVTRERLEAVTRRMVGHGDFGVGALHQASSFTDRSRQAATYRAGRVLLAGDSAHVHSPLGAQGLNAGIGDAVNLGWKLARVARAHAPEGLLDTYTRERHPAGAAVLEWSRAQVATLRPDPSSRALAGLVRDLVGTPDGTTYFMDRIWGFSQRCDMGGGGGGAGAGAGQDQLHPIVGCSAPDFDLVDGLGPGRLGELMRSGHGLLVDFGHEDPHGPGLSELAGDGAWYPRVDYVGARAKDDLGFRALLVRPDGVVAWVAERGSLDLDSAKAALSRWFGSGA